MDGDRLTHAEIAAFLVLLSVAGNDTTRHTTSHAIRALSVNPDQRALLMEDLDARLPTAVEEFVRWATPVMTFRRTTTARSSSTGSALEPGERVVLFYHSGNRDETPSSIRGTSTSLATRTAIWVLAAAARTTVLGHPGSHAAAAIFCEMLRVIPDIEANEPELLRSAFIHGVKRMEVSFTPRA